MHMNDFKKDFELRRVIFGLTSIMTSPQIPDIVNMKLPDIMNQLALLSSKMHSERLATLKDNREHIAKGGDNWDSSEDEMDGMDGEEDFEDSEEEFQKQQKMLSKLGPKLQTGKALTADEMKEFALEDDGGSDDDAEDSDYEYNGGDMSLYDSQLDDVDEIQFLKQAIQHIQSTNGQ